MPQPKKVQTIFADDLLPDDMPATELPQDAPIKHTSVANRSKPSKGLPSAKVDTGPVSISNPHPNMDMSRQAANFLSSFNNQDIGEEEEEANEAPPVEVTLPAIIQTALSTERGEVKSYQMANIVSQAPGPVQAQLKKIGRDIFSQYSEAPKTLKDIYAITSLTNSETEVKLMLAWVVMHGRKISDAQYNFPSMPGYRPKAEVWEADEARFLIVRETPKDFAGEEIEETFDDPDFEDKVDNKECIFYIYGWDEPKEKLTGNTVKTDLLEAATQLAVTDGAVTIQEAFNLLVEEYMLSENKEEFLSDFPPPGKRSNPDFQKIMEKLKKDNVDYLIDENGFLNVEGDVNLENLELETFGGIKFGYVTGHFHCNDNQLTTLEGAPKKVDRGFSCSDNQLTTLKGAPKEVSEYFSCSYNLLTTLKGAPESVGGSFYCSYNSVSKKALLATLANNKIIESVNVGRRGSRTGSPRTNIEDEGSLSDFKKPSRQSYEAKITFYSGLGYLQDEDTRRVKFSAISTYEALKMIAYITTYSTVKKPSAEEFEDFWNNFLEDNEGDAETIKGLKGFIKYNAEDYDVLYLKDFTGEIIFTTKKEKSNNAVDWDESAKTKANKIDEVSRRLSRTGSPRSTIKDEDDLSNFKKPSRQAYEVKILFWGDYDGSDVTKKIKFSALNNYEALKMVSYIAMTGEPKKPSPEKFEEFWDDLLEDDEFDISTEEGLGDIIKFNAPQNYSVKYLKDSTGKVIFMSEEEKFDGDEDLDWDD